MFQVCKSDHHSDASRPNPGSSLQVAQSSRLLLIQLPNQTEGEPPQTGEDWGFAEKDAKSVSAKKKLKQDQGSTLKQTKLSIETERNKDKVQSNNIANQSQNSSSTEPGWNQDDGENRKSEEKQVLVEMVLEQNQAESTRTEPNQLEDSPETKPAI